MKILMFHCSDFEFEITGLSNRPRQIKPEKISKRYGELSNCIVAFINVEKQDLNLKSLSINLFNEILKFVEQTKSCSVAICPFAHLSNSLADSGHSIKFFDLLEKLISKKIQMIRGHFGSDKFLSMKVFGHKGNVRFREF